MCAREWSIYIEREREIYDRLVKCDKVMHRHSFDHLFVYTPVFTRPGTRRPSLRWGRRSWGAQRIVRHRGTSPDPGWSRPARALKGQAAMAVWTDEH